MFLTAVVAGEGDTSREFESLLNWLLVEPRLTGKVRRHPVDQHSDTSLGSLTEVVAIAVGSGGAATAIVHTVSAWIKTRRSDIKIRLRSGDQEIELESTNIENAEKILSDFIAHSTFAVFGR